MKFSRCNGDAISSPSSFRPLPSGSYTPLQTMRPALPAVQISLWAYLSQTKDMAPFDTLSVLHHFWQKHEEWGRRRTEPHRSISPSNEPLHWSAPCDAYLPPCKLLSSRYPRTNIGPKSSQWRDNMGTPEGMLSLAAPEYLHLQGQPGVFFGILIHIDGVVCLSLCIELD